MALLLCFTRQAADLVTSLHYGLDKVYLADKLKIDSFENHVNLCQKFSMVRNFSKCKVRYTFLLKREKALVFERFENIILYIVLLLYFLSC